MAISVDRFSFVQSIVSQHRTQFDSYADRDAAKAWLLPFVLAELIRFDGPRWALISKTDQGGKIPNDIVMWTPTEELFDCLTDDGAAWMNKGVNPDPGVWVPYIPPPGNTSAPSTSGSVEASPEPIIPTVVLTRQISAMRAANLENTERLYQQQERVFNNLIAQLQELKAILLGATARTNVFTPQTRTDVVHLSQASLDGLGAILAGWRKP